MVKQNLSSNKMHRKTFEGRTCLPIVLPKRIIMAATYQFILRTDKINKKGETPIYLRIIKQRKTTNLATGVRIEARYWDEIRKCVKTTHPNSTRFNAYLNQLRNDYEA